MLCDNCGSEVRPVVALDIDGTLGDYHGHFLRFAEQYLGWSRDGVQYRGRPQFKEWFCRAYAVTERDWRDIKLAYRQGAQKRSMPVYPGAAQLCEAILAAGSDLWLTTTRPYLRLDNVDPDTRAWLARNEITYTGLLYDEHKYRLLAEQVMPERVVMVLDDEVEQYHEAGAVFGWRVPVMRRTLYNEMAVPEGVTSLEQARDLVLERIEQWRTTHDS